MAKEDRFFQLPLPLLAYHGDIDERISQGIDYAIVTAGKKILAGRCIEDFDDKVVELEESGKYACNGGAGEYAHGCILLGAETLGVTGGNAKSMWNNHKEIEVFLNEWDATGKHPLFRLRNDYVWDVRQDRGMTYLELSTLAGIYSILGAKNFPFRITRDQVICRQLGYRNTEEMKKRLKKRKDGLDPMTTDQVRYLLDKLETRGFFARTQASKSVVLFSHRKTHDELLEATKGWKARKAEMKERRAKERAALFTDSPLIPHYNSDEQPGETGTIVPTHSPRVPHEVPTNSPPVPHGVPTIIKTGKTDKQLNSEADDTARKLAVASSDSIAQQIADLKRRRAIHCKDYNPTTGRHEPFIQAGFEDYVAGLDKEIKELEGVTA